MKTQNQTLPLVVRKTIEAAIRNLEAAGCEFRVIDSAGNSYGTLEVVEKKKKKMNPDRPYGALREYYDQYVDYKAPVGTVIQIPAHHQYKPEEIRSGVCAKLSTHWGKGTYTTAVSKQGAVEILRIA